MLVRRSECADTVLPSHMLPFNCSLLGKGTNEIRLLEKNNTTEIIDNRRQSPALTPFFFCGCSRAPLLICFRRESKWSEVNRRQHTALQVPVIEQCSADRLSDKLIVQENKRTEEKKKSRTDNESSSGRITGRR